MSIREVTVRDLERDVQRGDAFVDLGFSQETADLLPGMRRWVTDEFHHSGLRTDCGRILDRLIGLARGTL